MKNAYKTFSDIERAIIHSDHGSQYTNTIYRAELANYGIIQSMNSDGGKCHDNACEAMWPRMKEKLLYGKYDTKQMRICALKTLIWSYYIIYWNNIRICTASDGLLPMVMRQRYYDFLKRAT